MQFLPNAKKSVVCALYILSSLMLSLKTTNLYSIPIDRSPRDLYKWYRTIQVLICCTCCSVMFGRLIHGTWVPVFYFFILTITITLIRYIFGSWTFGLLLVSGYYECSSSEYLNDMTLGGIPISFLLLWKTLTNRNSGEERVYWLLLLGHGLMLREIREELK